MKVEQSLSSTTSLEKVVRGYSSPYWWYDIRGIFVVYLAHQDSLTRLVSFFAANGSSNHLEVAVGSGSLLGFAMLWRQYVKKLPPSQGIAIDYSPEMLRGAAARLQKRGWKVQREDAAHLPFADGSFATANMPNAFHSIPDAVGATAEMFRVLRPGGTAAMNIVLNSRGGALRRWFADRVTQWGIRTGMLVRTYAEAEVKEIMLSQGFEVLESSIHGNDLYLLLRKPSLGV